MTKQKPDLASSAVDRTQMRKHAEAIVLPVVELDLDYNIIYVNKPAMVLLALDEAALANGVHADDLVSSEQVSMIHGGLAELAKGATPTPMSLRIVRSDNVQVLTHVFTQNVFHRGKHAGFVVFAVDLSRRESIEERFREKEEIFELIVEHSSVTGNIIVDDNFTLEYVNDKLCDMVGRRRSELLGHDFKEFLHPDSIELVVDRYKKRLAGEEVPTDYEFKILKKDGTPRDFMVSSKVMASRSGPVKTIAQLIDITEETERKRALEQSERRNRMLVEAMHSGFCISDEEANVVLVNDSLCRMLGFSSIDELVGKPLTTIVHGWTEANAQEKIEERKKGKTARYELTLKGKLGEKVPAIVSAAPLFNASGEFIGTFAIFADISDLKNAEDEVRFLLDLLLHDIGNQLQLILAGADMLTSDSTEKQIEKSKRYVLDGTERCLELITNIRKTEESKSEPLVPVQLNNILSAETQLFSSQHGVRPEVTDIPDDIIVYADGALGHLFWNIMENAVKHNKADEKSVWIRGKKKGKTFKVLISDNGPGLRGTRKDHLLDPGRRYGGVGLHLVRRLAEKYGANLEVRDRVKGKHKQGLEIVISLRIAD